MKRRSPAAALSCHDGTMTDSDLMPTANQVALANVVVDIEKTASRIGWDAPSALYALVPTAQLLAQPDLPADVADSLRQGWDGSDAHLSAIAQDDLPHSDELTSILESLAWPDQVAGAALTTEIVTVPPEVEAAAPADEDEALEFIATHPSRTEVRLAVGVLRTGESWCALRARTFDSDDKVGQGSQLVPEIVQALAASFDPEEAELC